MIIIDKLLNPKYFDTNLKCSVISAIFSATLFVTSLLTKSLALLILTPILAKIANMLIALLWQKSNPDFDINDHDALDNKARCLNFFFLLWLVVIAATGYSLSEYVAHNKAFPIFSIISLAIVLIFSRLYLIGSRAPFALHAFLFKYKFFYNLTEEERTERRQNAEKMLIRSKDLMINPKYEALPGNIHHRKHH